MDKKHLFRSIPKVDMLLEKEEIKKLIDRYGRTVVVDAIRKKTEDVRELIRTSVDESLISEQLSKLVGHIKDEVEEETAPHLCPVINATGTILHTNLGRAPISEAHGREMMKLVTGYSNLEYDLEQGNRGLRYDHFEDLLVRLTGAEAAIAVNNNAAAVLLSLAALARGGEVMVSRGELVEIGGKFRIPDVCAESGAALVEVGTTNKTHLWDYEQHLSESTKAILKVHTSNYRIVGFTEEVSVAELKPLAAKAGIPIIHDLGSGVLMDLRRLGLPYEPTVWDACAQGADVVCFSGDKLLGGPQAGIIVGKKKYIDRIKQHPLTRALRIDKFTVAALNLVLLEYMHEETVAERIPVLHMIKEAPEKIQARALALKALLDGAGLKASYHVAACESKVGGGALPLISLESFALVLWPEAMSLTKLEEKLRRAKTPVIGRITKDRLYLDLRTVTEAQLPVLAEVLKEVLR